MNQMTASRAFFLAMVAIIGACIFASYHFFTSLNQTYILVHTGATPHRHVLDHYKFLQNKKGLIFSLTFLFAGASMLIMIVLPSDDRPIRRAAAPPEPKPVPESRIAAEVPPAAPAAEPVPEAPIEKPRPTKKAAQIQDVEQLEEDVDFTDEGYEDITEGEDDVVYGTGSITNAAVVDFVHKFPDSALKFLYRKQLDGKTLTNEEERIYTEWENRGMTRAKVKQYIQALMDWEKMPREPLYEMWKKIRDHIYDTIHF